jgi:NTP pyrophosphatase (non-canonical NTP hydrolase)
MNTIISEVLSELDRATKKFPTWPTDPLHALAVVGEEYGELTQKVLQRTYEPAKHITSEMIREEAIQTAAMALRFAMSLDSYLYQALPQHQQSPIIP